MYDTLSYVDIDALKATRAPLWQRLHDLAQKQTLQGAEIDELALLYRQGSADLAAVRADDPDPDIIRGLSRDLASARARLTGTEGITRQKIAEWFKITLPAALFHARWWIIITVVSCVAVALIQAWWILRDPAQLALLGSPEELKQYAEHSFVDYYDQDTHSQFGLSVWFNNAFIAVQCIAGGITGVYPLYVLLQNSLNVGVAGAVVTSQTGLGHFLSFILPHGLPELTAIFIAGGAGLRIFGSLIAPGRRTRSEALSETARAMITISLGLVILLFISGAIEGFITPSSLPVAVKIGCGGLVTVAVWVYILVIGRRAARSGATGDLDVDAGYYAPVA